MKVGLVSRGMND